MGRAGSDVLAERIRQKTDEGYSEADDDKHVLGQLGLAAALYAIPYETRIGGVPMVDQDSFIGLDMSLAIVGEWDLKPEPDRRKRLVKAGALILAEIERLDRAATTKAEAAA